jgi:hypothetical protein
MALFLGLCLTSGAAYADCERPYPPYPSNYQSRSAYNEARELYYSLATNYVNHCVDEWVRQIRVMYEEMMAQEIEPLIEDRSAVLNDLREATKREY